MPREPLSDSLLPAGLDALLPDPLLVHDHGGRILAVSDKACEFLGYARAELLSMNLLAVEQDLDPATAMALWSTVTRERPATLFGNLRRRDGSVVAVSYRIGLVEHAAPRRYCATVHVRDGAADSGSVVTGSTVHLRALLEAMVEGFLVHDRDGRIIDANRAAEQILGVTRAELLGRTPTDPAWEVVREDMSPMPASETPAMETLRTGRPLRNQLLGLRTADGDVRWLRISSHPVTAGAEARPLSVVMTFVDVTLKRRFREELRVARADLQTILDNVPATISYWTRELRCRFANRSYAELFGADPDRLEGAQLKDIIGADLYALTTPYITRALAGEPQSFVRGYVTTDGAKRYHQVAYMPDGPRDAVRGLYVIATDITALYETQDQLRQLAHRLQRVREEDRARVALALHEGLAQELCALRLQLDQLRSPRAGGDGAAWAELSAAISRAVGTTRELANDLRPSALSHLCVSVAIAEYAREFDELTGLRVNLRMAEDLPPLDAAPRVILFRALEETLANVAAHARATHVDVAMQHDAEGVSLEVSDDGVGIPAIARATVAGLGLFGLRESLAAHGGTLAIEDREPHGTRVIVRLPVGGESAG